MSADTGKIITRIAQPNDVGQLCLLLNEIILIGGTTALKNPLTDTEFNEYILQGKNHLCCYVAIDEQGHFAGFQAMERHPDLPSNWADIATFARINPKLKGVGSVLFAQTKLRAKQLGIIAINATIRAHNTGGLIYYEKMGFETYKTSDDTDPGQISKQFYVE